MTFQSEAQSISDAEMLRKYHDGNWPEACKSLTVKTTERVYSIAPASPEATVLKITEIFTDQQGQILLTRLTYRKANGSIDTVITYLVEHGIIYYRKK